MQMTKEQFRNEHLYETTMFHLRGMLEKELLTEDEYRDAEADFRKKYMPITDGLLCDITCYVAKTER